MSFGHSRTVNQHSIIFPCDYKGCGLNNPGMLHLQFFTDSLFCTIPYWIYVTDIVPVVRQTLFANSILNSPKN